jgi:hypothetical protein
MAYDEELAERVRELLGLHGEVSERRMFGGVGFLVAGNMACGVIGDDLIVRVGPDQAEQALRDPNAREFDFTGRPMKGWVYVTPAGTSADDDLEGWVEAGAGFASSLPEK